MSKFKVGDKVKVIVPYSATPYYGWGRVESGEIGIVSAIETDSIQSGVEVRVDFRLQSRWSARESELELVGATTTDAVPACASYGAACYPVTAESGEVKEKEKRKLYAVCRDTGAVVCVEKTRQAARETKAALGGKEAGFSILQFKETKEVR